MIDMWRGSEGTTRSEVWGPGKRKSGMFPNRKGVESKLRDVYDTSYRKMRTLCEEKEEGKATLVYMV